MDLSFASRLSLLVSLSCAALACGGSDGAPPSDSAATGGEPGTGGEPATGGESGVLAPELKTSSKADMPGYETTLTAALDAEGAKYQWRLVSAPPKSALEQADVLDADAATARFVPDLGGEYVFEVTATADAETQTREVRVKPPTYDVPFVEARVEDGVGASEVTRVVKSGGEDTWEIARRFERPGVTPEAWTSGEPFIYGAVGQRVDFPDSISGTARMINSIFTSEDAEGLIEISRSDTRCSGSKQPVEIAGYRQSPFAQPPEFSPDGSRVVFVHLDQAAGTSGVLTFDVTSGAARTLFSPPWPEGDVPFTIATWVSPTRVLWVDLHDPDGSGEQAAYGVVYEREDNAAASNEVVVDCGGVANPLLGGNSELAYIDGSLYVLLTSSEVWRLDKNDEGKWSCDAASPFNHRLLESHRVREFELDPFGERILFVGVPAEAPDNAPVAIYVAPADGSEVPQQVSADDGSEPSSAHWTVAGRQFVWVSHTEEELPAATGGSTFDSPSLARLHRANADGTHSTVIWAAETPGRDGVQALMGQSNGFTFFCSYLPLGSSAPVALSLLTAGALVVARRRRQSTAN